MIKADVFGDIPIKKNRQRIGRGGHIYKPQAVTDYEEIFGFRMIELKLRGQSVAGQFKLSGEFHIKKQKDLDGVITTLLDCLEMYDYIEDDKLCMQFEDVKKFIVPRGEQDHIHFTISTVE